MQNHDDQDVTIFAGFFVRLAAYLIDAILVGAVLFIVRVPVWVASLMSPNNLFVKPVIFIFSAFDILLYLLSALYFIIMTYNAGATIGKRLMSIKVISADEEKLSLLNVIYRESIGKYLSAVIMSIGFILAGIDKEKRALHDILCDTRVVYTCKMKLVYPAANVYGSVGTNQQNPYVNYPVYQPNGQPKFDQNGQPNGEPEVEPKVDQKEESQEDSFHNMY